MSVGPARSLKPACLALPGLVEPQTHMCELCILFNLIINSRDLEIVLKLRDFFNNNHRFSKLGSFSAKYSNRC